MISQKQLEDEKAEDRPRDPIPDTFFEWWYPHSVDDNGVDVGGHPDAERVWGRTDNGGETYHRKVYGIRAAWAWPVQEYREAYEEWMLLGQPQGDFASYALPLAEQKIRWAEVSTLLQKIGLPVAPAHPKELQDAKRSGEKRTLIETEDLPPPTMAELEARYKEAESKYYESGNADDHATMVRAFNEWEGAAYAS